MKRAFIGLIGLFLLLAPFAHPAGASGLRPNTNLTVSPTAGPRGTAVGASAVGLDPDTAYLVQVVRGIGNVNTVRVFEETARSTARGELHYRLAMDQEPGQYTVRIVAIGGTVLATAPFTVTAGRGVPTLTLAPDHGPCTTQPVLGGSGFPAGAAIAIYGQRTGPSGGPASPPRLVNTVTAAPNGDLPPFTQPLPEDPADCAAGRTPAGTRYTFTAVPPGASIDATTEPERRIVFTVTGTGGGGADEHHFAETGHTVRGRFLAYWQAHGLDLGDRGVSFRESLALFGYPLSEERREVLEDGREYTVQYFERVRLELHPENPAPYDVLLGQFGRRVLRDRFGADEVGHREATEPAAAVADAAYFVETGHNLGGRFLDYWRANGGLAQFGYPLTEEFDEWGLVPNRGLRVQYFERARLEYHPDNAGTPYAVLLGQFGRQILADVDLLRSGPMDAFHRLYIADEGVHGRLGRPVSPVFGMPGAVQAFEHGWMLYRSDRGQIFVLCGETTTGRLVVSGRSGEAQTPYFADTWAEGQTAGGGPGPRPGLYEPARGFGKVWREGVGGYNEVRVRDCLGYATSAQETGYEMAVQEFERGLLIAGPGGQSVYVLSYGTQKGFGLAGDYTVRAVPQP